MKDLTSSDAFRMHNAHGFDKTIARVIKSSDWDLKLEEIKAWQKEQERLKHLGTEDSLGTPMDDYETTTDLSDQERTQQFLSSNKSEYEKQIDFLQEQLGINQHSQFNQPMPTGRNPRSNIFSRWLTFSRAGKNLSTTEIENNKKLIKIGNNQESSDDTDGETKFQQEYRMNSEDWKSYLYSYRLSGYLSILSLFGTITGMSVLFTPSYYPLIASLVGALFSSYKLKDFNDGPLNGNYLGSNINLDNYTKFYNQQQNQQSQNQQSQNQNQDRENKSHVSLDDDLFNDDNNGKFSDDDFGDIDDLDDIDDFGEPVPNNSESDNLDDSLSTKEGQVTHNEQAKFKDDGTSIPQSDIDVSNDQELYEAEEEFLKMVYRNRAELSKHLETPYDILKVFAPLIVNFNKDFADTRIVPRDSWEFKNISYLIGSTYDQMNAKFRSAGTGTDAKYDPDYYFFIDEITETGLFYKIKLRLPDCISRNDLLKNMDNMKNNLKKSTTDVVDISTELPNQVGYLKIYKITTSKDGKNAFLPLVSTGDVMRFNGMKTIGGKPLIEDLNAPDDLKILMGLSNAEQALTLDIAGDQNTSIAIAGFTGSGKTASTGSWLTNILVTHSPDEVGFIIVDPKSGSFWENFRLAPHVLGYFDGKEIDKVPSMMGILKGVEIARQDHLNKDVHAKNYYEARRLFKKRGNWERVKEVPRLFIVMDEQLALSSSLQNMDNDRNAINKTLPNKEKKFASFYESYKSQVGGLANIVREGGMTIMALSQRTVDKAFPRSLLSASSIKFMMKLQFTSDAEKLLGEGAEYPDPTSLPTGSGYLMANGLRLTQLTTPLFSGNPDKLEEVTRIIALAWTIIYDYNHDINKEPPYYYLSSQSKENVETMQNQEIDIYNVFNRDKIFKDAKDILKGNQKLHFDPEYDTDFKLDLDADRNEQNIDLQDTKQQYENQRDDKNIDNDIINNKEVNKENVEQQKKEQQYGKLNNMENINLNKEEYPEINGQFNDNFNENDFNDDFDENNFDNDKNNIKNDEFESSNKNSNNDNFNSLNNENNHLSNDIQNNDNVNNQLSLSDLIKKHNNQQSQYNKDQFDTDIDNVHKTDYENEYIKDVYDEHEKDNNIQNNQNSQYQNSAQPSYSLQNPTIDDNNVIDGDYHEINNDNQNKINNDNQLNNSVQDYSVQEYSEQPHIKSKKSEKDDFNNIDINQENSEQNNFNQNDDSDIDVNQENHEQNTLDQNDDSSNNSEQNTVEQNDTKLKENKVNDNEIDNLKIDGYNDTTTDLVRFFRDNNLNKVKMNILFKLFSMNTIRKAIDKKIISTGKNHDIKLIYV